MDLRLPARDIVLSDIRTRVPVPRGSIDMREPEMPDDVIDGYGIQEPTAYIEHHPVVVLGVIDLHQEEPDVIIDMEEIPNLIAVSVDGDRQPLIAGLTEPGYQT